MTTLNLQVDASDGDAHQEGYTNYFRSSTSLYVIANATESNRSNLGALFESVPIDVGSTIDSCTAELYSWFTFFDDLNSDLFFIDEDDPAVFGEVSPTVNDRTKTSASVAWDQDAIDEAWSESPDLAVPLQEVIDRGGWASGNNLGYVVVGSSDATKTCWMHSYDGNTANAPKLNIDFTPPASGHPSMERDSGVPHVGQHGFKPGHGW